MLSKRTMLLVALVATTLVGAWCVSALPGVDTEDRGARVTDKSFRSRLAVEAEKAGVAINLDETMMNFHGQRAWVVAPIRGFEHVPATALVNGTDAAFGYVQGVRGVPAGYYTLRAWADEVKPGAIEGRVQFINAAGEVVGERATPMRVTSMTVPKDLPANRQRVNIVAAADYLTLQANERVAPVDEQPIEVVWIICSNGLIICIYD